MSTSTYSEARRLVGGRWAVSWQGYLILLPFSIPLSLLVVPTFFQPSKWLEGVVVAAVAYVVTGGILALASATVLRSRRTRPAPVIVVSLIGGIAWAARSAVFGAWLQAAGEYVDTPILERLSVGFLLGAFFVPGAAWLLATIDGFRIERARLLNELAQHELAAESSQAYLNLMRTELLAQVTDQLHDVTSSVTTTAPSTAEEQRVSAAELASLEAAIHRTSKELAPALWEDASHDTKVTPRIVLLAAARHPFYLAPIPFIAAIQFTFVLRFTPLLPTMLTFIISSAWVVVTVMIANATCRRARTPSIWRYAAFVTLLAACGPVATLALIAMGMPPVNSATGEHRSYGMFMLTVSAPFVLYMVASGIARALDTAEVGVLSAMRESITIAEVRSLALQQDEVRLRREIAAHLHGTVAANLTAAVLRLRHAMASGDLAESQAAYAEALRQLDADMQHSFDAPSASVYELLRDLGDSWSGIVELQIDVSPELSTTPAMTRAALEVVTEAVNNAVRHADAEHITVAIDEANRIDDTTSIDIVVIDDGTRREHGPRGLGTALFEEATAGNWTRKRNDSGGSTVRLTLGGTSQHGLTPHVKANI